MSSVIKISDVLTRDEIRGFQQKSNLRAYSTLCWNYSLIVAAFALPILWTNPLTVLFGIFLLAGRQLGLGILTHDCAHHALFQEKRMNDFVGRWLCGLPVNINVFDYRQYHLKHHRFAGTEKDPDIIFVKNYPVTKASLKRKFIRDFSGQTGIRDMKATLSRFKLARDFPWLAFHLGLLTVLTLAGAAWAYLLWWAAELFVLPALVRLRQVGEHGTAADRSSQDPRLNTGTTLAPWWQRVFIAPNDVNYHLEHHFMASVPPYNLRSLHELLVERGFYAGFDCVARGYGDVVRRAVQ